MDLHSSTPPGGLIAIGRDLDRGRYPRVYDGGIVRPSNPSVRSNPQGKENEDEFRKSASGSAARPWERSAGGQRSARRPRPAHSAAPVVEPRIRYQYEGELTVLQTAYPGIKVWRRDEGVWLLAESLIFEGLQKKATFLVAIPFTPGGRAIAWGYWTTAVSATWIGPRHTNFPEGSVCAFEPRDHTWVIGQPIITLLDLYSVWALRHLHLEMIGRWPGQQSVPVLYERILELNDDEFCGCDRGTRRYAECCKASDHAADQVLAALEFANFSGGVGRRPPDWVAPVIWGVAEPPAFSALQVSKTSPPTATVLPKLREQLRRDGGKL